MSSLSLSLHSSLRNGRVMAMEIASRVRPELLTSSLECFRLHKALLGRCPMRSSIVNREIHWWFKFQPNQQMIRICTYVKDICLQKNQATFLPLLLDKNLLHLLRCLAHCGAVMFLQ
jgi:hypothetical protein